jgi:Cys-tRNA(Pro)/Cys-tRNA(Cys) deacylase
VDPIPPASRFLTDRGIPHRVFRHRGQIESLEQAALEREQNPNQVVRSIVFRLGKGDFIMVLVAGPYQISWQSLRAHFGQSRLTMANDEEVFQATGYRPGAVSPFGLTLSMKTLADVGVFLHEEISIGSGVRGIAIIMKSSDLKAALESIEVGKFVSQANQA